MVFEIVEAFICVANSAYIGILIIYYNWCLALKSRLPLRLVSFKTLDLAPF